MFKIKFPFKKYLILFILFLSTGLYLGYKLTRHTETSKEWNYSNHGDVKYLSEDTVLQEIKTVSKLIPLEVELSETIVIDNSIGNLDFLKKYKRIKFYANCSYSVDLSKVSDKDIILNQDKSTIKITLPKPIVFSVDINEDKTLFEEPTKGILRFGDIAITPEEYNSILKEITSRFESRLNTDEVYQKSLDNTSNSIKNLLSSTFKKDLKIEVTFIDD